MHTIATKSTRTMKEAIPLMPCIVARRYYTLEEGYIGEGDEEVNKMTIWMRSDIIYLHHLASSVYQIFFLIESDQERRRGIFSMLG